MENGSVRATPQHSRSNLKTFDRNYPHDHAQRCDFHRRPSYVIPRHCDVRDSCHWLRPDTIRLKQFLVSAWSFQAGTTTKQQSGESYPASNRIESGFNRTARASQIVRNLVRLEQRASQLSLALTSAGPQRHAVLTLIPAKVDAFDPQKLSPLILAR